MLNRNYTPWLDDAWTDAAYISAVPDFRSAPAVMFTAPPGWGTPDPKWQLAHPNWEPEAGAVPVAGYPLALSGWRFWQPKREVLRVERHLRFKRAARYSFFAALYSLGVLALVAGFFGLLFPPAAIFIVFVAGQEALAGSIVLWLAMLPVVGLLDMTYLAALRRGVKESHLLGWTLAPVFAVDLVVTLAVALLFRQMLVLSGGGEDDIVTWTATVAALASPAATVPMLVTYALNELRLQR